jgi:hypothetical protein
MPSRRRGLQQSLRSKTALTSDFGGDDTQAALNDPGRPDCSGHEAVPDVRAVRADRKGSSQ